MRLSKKAEDVFVIGGGPAGLAAAIAARNCGFDVTVADGLAPLIDKACGEGLMPATQAALRQLGVQLPVSFGYRFKGIRFVENSTAVAAEFPHGRGVGMRRTVLHACMVRAAENCGVKICWKTPVLGIRPEGVRLNSGWVPAKWIVGADGGHSRVRSWSGLEGMVTNRQRFASRRHYRVDPWSEFMDIFWGPRVQGYVTPIAEDEVCVVMMGESSEDVEFDRALSVLPELQDRLRGAELSSRERGAVTAMQSLRRVCRDKVALVGDASGGVDAITGEGLRLAFLQASTLAEAMRRGDLRHYQRQHRKLAGRPMLMGAMLKRLGRHDRLRQRALKMLSQSPEMFAQLLAYHVGYATRADLIATGVALGWQLLAG